MAETFFIKPIINSPYKPPVLHWKLDLEGQPPNKLIEFRRRCESSHWPPTQRNKKSKDQEEMLLDASDYLSDVDQDSWEMLNNDTSPRSQSLKPTASRSRLSTTSATRS